MEWMERAQCRKLHADFWFPPVFKEERTAPESHYYEIAKMVCETCPVADPCRKLGAEEEHGVWGGWTPKERRTGTHVPPKRSMSNRFLHKLPEHKPNTQVDIPAIKVALKPYTDKRG